MALQGTIKDFALPDIFQLIGMQRKTGVLTLENSSESVTIKFLDGQVVGADTKSATLEDRLGELLVRTGRISQDQLEQALRQQENTLQRLGHILVQAGRISEEELIEALRVQSSQVIYRLFRWTEGRYHFAPVSDLDYDQAHFQPISSETILMEGARMIDEWPLIQRRIKSDRMVLARTAACPRVGPQGGDASLELISLDAENIDRPEEAKTPGPRLSAEEETVLALVDARRSVAEICDMSALGEFDTCRILSDLVTRNLLEPAQAQEVQVALSSRTDLMGRLGQGSALALLLVVVTLVAATLAHNPATPWRLLRSSAISERLRLYSSMARLEKIEKAIQVFYLDAGTFPRSTSVLAQNGYLTAQELQDPWGRHYQYELSAGGYRLSGAGPEGQVLQELTVSRNFNSTQRMMMQGDGALPPDP